MTRSLLAQTRQASWQRTTSLGQEHLENRRTARSRHGCARERCVSWLLHCRCSFPQMAAAARREEELNSYLRCSGTRATFQLFGGCAELLLCQNSSRLSCSLCLFLSPLSVSVDATFLATDATQARGAGVSAAPTVCVLRRFTYQAERLPGRGLGQWRRRSASSHAQRHGRAGSEVPLTTRHGICARRVSVECACAGWHVTSTHVAAARHPSHAQQHA